MRSLAFLILALSTTAIPVAAEARSESNSPGVRTTQTRVIHHRWGPRVQGRWYAGWRAPGGWIAYQPPVRGYVVHPWWVAPIFYVGDYAAYGLRTPPYGLAWSRYYDDAVLIDARGIVYDSVSGVDWDGYAYEDRRRGDDGVGGAIIGGAVGAIAGNRIAGSGNRTAGTLIGAGAGALAGMAIDKAENGGGAARPAPAAPRYDYDFGPLDERIAGAEGSWTGQWEGRYVDSTNRRYEGTFRGTYNGPAGATYPAPAYAPQPAPGYGYGYGAGYPGYGYAVPIAAQPVITETITTVEEEVIE